MAVSDFERYPLTFGPSPIHPLPRLTQHLGGGQLWAKREDVNSGLAFGGNKTRKLEYQENWVDWPDPLSDRVGNILLSRIMGATVTLDDAGFDIGIRSSWQRAIDEVIAAGGTPYPIPAGASDHRLGGLGFANWAYEVEQQERELGVFFDTIIVCTVTGSAQAGMIAGFAGQDRARAG